ncbi:caspase-7-like [Hydra vulgaris]|uniref:Caspase-7-like n=1 Tax=Hydra vulgaris TaxID=6087 RepID=A0ABM4B9L4_HYDVU
MHMKLEAFESFANNKQTTPENSDKNFILDSQLYYALNSNSVEICHIISNSFNKSEVTEGYFPFLRRTGTQNDVIELEKSILDIIKSPPLNEEKVDCFVCCILSYGFQDGVYGADAFQVERYETSNDPKSLAESADFRFSVAASSGTDSWRHTIHGSWYIQELCKVLKENAVSESLLNMLTAFNAWLCNKVSKYTDISIKQMSTIRIIMTLTKLHRFKPLGKFREQDFELINIEAEAVALYCWVEDGLLFLSTGVHAMKAAYNSFPIDYSWNKLRVKRFKVTGDH